MSVALGLVAAWIFLSFLYLRFFAVGSVLRWLRAQPAPADALWGQVRASVTQMAREQRAGSPEVWVLPEFAPNALFLRGRPRGAGRLCLSEGLVRALSAEELETAVSLCLHQGAQRGRRRQLLGSLLFFPLARRLQRGPATFRFLLAPVLSSLLRLFSRPKALYAADAAAARQHGPWQVAATLQKLSVLGQKIPQQRWNLAIDGLFLVAPLSLGEGPHWALSAQPSVPARRERLLQAPGASA